jgi:glycosyltransferase involved in cell wall biosynthesis
MWQKNPMPRVTIGIPCLNEEAFIRQAVDSALNQTYPNIEIVISDAGSEDRTPEFLKQFESHDNVKVLYCTKGTSKYNNWSAMVEASTGDYILILLAKHLLYADGIEKLINPVIRNTDRNFAYIRGCMVWRYKDETKLEMVPAQLSGIKDSREELLKLLTGNTCETISTLYQMNAFRSAMPFDTDFDRTFVWLLNARLASRGAIYFRNTSVAEWIDHETPEFLIKKRLKALEEIPTLYEKFETLCSSGGLKVNIADYRDKWTAQVANADSRDSIYERVVKRHKLQMKCLINRSMFRSLSLLLGK